MTGHTDVVMDATACCFSDDTFDIVFASEVAEHILEPAMCIAEVRRILRPGGLAYLTVPFHYAIHGGKGDYWRFTEEGLAYLMRDFYPVNISPQGTLPHALLDAITVGSHYRVTKVLRLLSLPLSILLRPRTDRAKVPVGYSVQAWKPDTNSFGARTRR
jgi:SAM-dependent methyltransferase